MTQRRVALGICSSIALVAVAAFFYSSMHRDLKRVPMLARAPLPRSAIEGLRITGRHRAPVHEARLVDTFHLLGGMPETMPSQLRVLARRTLGTQTPGLDFSSAQYVHTAAGAIWLVKGQQVACLVQAIKGAVSCTTFDRFLHDGLMLGLFSAPISRPHQQRKFSLMGVVPNSVRRIVLRTGSTLHDVRVHENAFGLKANRPILPQGSRDSRPFAR
jgi:hypothetical protein